MRKSAIFFIALFFGIIFFCGQKTYGQANNIGMPTTYPTQPLKTYFGNNPGYGIAVDFIGDIDRDNYLDIIVGSNGPGNDNAYVLSGANGTIIYSYSGGSGYGMDVVGLGDINGDSVEDFAVGEDSIRVIIYDGASGAMIRSITNPVNLTNVYFARDIDSLNDINGDGRNEVIVSGPSGIFGQFTSAYVFDALSGVMLLTLAPPSATVGAAPVFGTAIADIGDINSDGLADIAVGGYMSLLGGNSYPFVSVYSGANGSLFYIINGPVGTGMVGSPNSISSAGDFNFDGILDFAVGDSTANNPFGNFFYGRIYVYSGSTGSVINTINGPTTALTQIGATLSGGDVNGDGYSDIVSGYGSSVYVFAGPNGNIIHSFSGRPGQGRSFSIADFDNDGFNEILVGLNNYNSLSSNGSAVIEKLGGVYSYGIGTLNASWMPVQVLSSQGTILVTGFTPGEQNICAALSGSPLIPGMQLSSGDFVYLNQSYPNFWIDCTLSADFTGTLAFNNINIRSSINAGQKIYGQAGVSRNGSIITSNLIEITKVP